MNNRDTFVFPITVALTALALSMI
jgi:PAS domain S-box-containing protein